VRRRYLDLLRAAVVSTCEGIQDVELLAPDAAPSDLPTEAASRVPLNPDYTFERFVIGPGNQLAHPACLAGADAPGQSYKLPARPGLAQARRLAAIASCVQRPSPELAGDSPTAESFTNEFGSRLRGAGIEGFREPYRGAAVLLIDDSEFLEGRARAADEFFHT